MSAAIVKAEPSTIRVQAMSTALREEGEIRDLLGKYVREHMKQDVDFGRIPGTQKDTLLKPGAQKLISLFRCSPRYTLVKHSEDFEKDFFAYTFRVRLVSRDTQEVLAEGYGSANSREGRYRWRDSSRKCPACLKETIIKGKEEYGGGWLCFAKKGGCNAKFKTGDPAIESQKQGRSENDDVATLANTILKMAKKRAEVDGAIALAHCADMFTQDLEDLADLEPAQPEQQQFPQQQPAKTAPRETSNRTAQVREQLKAKSKPAQVVDVKPGETEEQAEKRAKAPVMTIYERTQILAREFGMTDLKKLGAFIKGSTGKLKGADLTEADLAVISKALAAIAPRDDGPPPPGDEDAPGFAR